MTSIYTNTFGEFRTESVDSYVSRNLEPDYEYGIAERGIKAAALTAEALARLCQILADKGVLDVDDIVKIAGKYEETKEFVIVCSKYGDTPK